MAENSSTNPPHVIVHGDAAGFAQKIEIGPHQLKGDEPAAAGGTDTGPTPYDFILAALGACTSMTIGLYARSRKWPLQGVTVSLHHSKIHAADCAECETKVGKIDRIYVDVQLTGDLTNAIRPSPRKSISRRGKSDPPSGAPRDYEILIDDLSIISGL